MLKLGWVLSGTSSLVVFVEDENVQCWAGKVPRLRFYTENFVLWIPASSLFPPMKNILERKEWAKSHSPGILKQAYFLIMLLESRWLSRPRYYISCIETSVKHVTCLLTRRHFANGLWMGSDYCKVETGWNMKCRYCMEYCLSHTLAWKAMHLTLASETPRLPCLVNIRICPGFLFCRRFLISEKYTSYWGQEFCFYTKSHVLGTTQQYYVTRFSVILVCYTWN